jgi:aminotransferase
MGAKTNEICTMSNEATPSNHLTLSRIARDLPPSGIRKFFDIAAQMQDVISLSVGEPDFATPWAIREAAIYSLERGQTTYTSNYGILELRQLIARHLEQLYGVHYAPADEILVTVGVSEGMDLAMRAILDPGDEVLIPEPCYVSYKPCISLAGGVPVGILTTMEDEFRVTLDQLEAARTSRTKAIVLGYPSNPTGATMPREQMQEIVDFAVRHNLYLISDEIYDRLTYDGQHTCVAALPGAWERTILLNGFSKAYAMTGWRVGYVCAPPELLNAMYKIHSYTIMCVPTTSQKAAIEALKSGETAVRDMVGQYNQRRRLIVDGLNHAGLECHLPQGAFYAFPSIRRTGLTSEAFAMRLIEEEHVAVVPGTAFGMGGEGHIRISYATSLTKIEEALHRISRFVQRVSPPRPNSGEPEKRILAVR